MSNLKENHFEDVRDELHVIIETGRHRNINYHEDVRKFPSNKIATEIFRAQHGIPEKKESHATKSGTIALR